MAMTDEEWEAGRAEREARFDAEDQRFEREKQAHEDAAVLLGKLFGADFGGGADWSVSAWFVAGEGGDVPQGRGRYAPLYADRGIWIIDDENDQYCVVESTTTGDEGREVEEIFCAPAGQIDQVIARAREEAIKLTGATRQGHPMRSENPLRPGHDRETVSHNISKMMHEGRPQKQAVAIALENARRHPNRKPRRKNPEGGWRPGVFHLDGVEAEYAGIWQGEFWNGWAVAYFDEPTAAKLLGDLGYVFEFSGPDTTESGLSELGYCEQNIEENGQEHCDNLDNWTRDAAVDVEGRKVYSFDGWAFYESEAHGPRLSPAEQAEVQRQYRGQRQGNPAELSTFRRRIGDIRVGDRVRLRDAGPGGGSTVWTVKNIETGSNPDWRSIALARRPRDGGDPVATIGGGWVNAPVDALLRGGGIYTGRGSDARPRKNPLTAGPRGPESWKRNQIDQLAHGQSLFWDNDGEYTLVVLGPDGGPVGWMPVELTGHATASEWAQKNSRGGEPPTRGNPTRPHVFPSGAKVYVDGRDLARVAQAFPEGSSSYMFPHYKVDIQGGDRNVAVRMDRVGVERRGNPSDEALRRRAETARRLAGPSMSPMLQAYVEAALFSSTDNADESGGEPLDKNYSASDIAPETMAAMASDVARFERENAEDLREGTSEQGGHDLWLTRAGHGAGFWDGDWPEPAATRLTEAAEKLGNVDLYVGDDKQIHQSPLSRVENPTDSDDDEDGDDAEREENPSLIKNGGPKRAKNPAQSAAHNPKHGVVISIYRKDGKVLLDEIRRPGQNGSQAVVLPVLEQHKAKPGVIVEVNAGTTRRRYRLAKKGKKLSFEPLRGKLGDTSKPLGAYVSHGTRAANPVMYGFEARDDNGQWSMEAAGEQNASNFFASKAEAQAELPNLARVLECDISEVRVVPVETRRPNPEHTHLSKALITSLDSWQGKKGPIHDVLSEAHERSMVAHATIRKAVTEAKGLCKKAKTKGDKSDLQKLIKALETTLKKDALSRHTRPVGNIGLGRRLTPEEQARAAHVREIAKRHAAKPMRETKEERERRLDAERTVALGTAGFNLAYQNEIKGQALGREVVRRAGADAKKLAPPDRLEDYAYRDWLRTQAPAQTPHDIARFYVAYRNAYRGAVGMR